MEWESVVSWVEQQRKEDGTPGLAIAVTDRQGLLHQAALGFASLESGDLLRTEHLLETGSIGKSFTAIALLQLQEAGLVDLQAPVTDYLPWFSIRSRFSPITLHHLLTHTAGISAGVDFAPAGSIQVWAMRDSEASAEPGTLHHYSNLGYKVLGAVLEEVTGERYPTIIQRGILDRLGLADSEPEITNAVRDRLAVGYVPRSDDRQWWPGRPLAPATWLETDTADGSLAQTVGDLAGYLRAYLNQGSGLITPESFSLMTQRTVPVPLSSSPTWYGYGLLCVQEGLHAQIGHTGGMVGYAAGIMGDPAAGLGVAVVVNGPGSPYYIARTVLTALADAADSGHLMLPDATPEPDHDDLARFIGTFVSTDNDADRLIVERHPSGIALRMDGSPQPLVSFGGDAFCSDHEAFDRFALTFEGEGDEMSDVLHGSNHYVREGAARQPSSPLPEDWRAFPGYYRSHNPWTPMFRVFAREGRLWLAFPSEPDGFEPEQPLVPIGESEFRCGEDERLPERVRFDTVLHGQALRAHLSIGEYYRVSTS